MGNQHTSVYKEKFLAKDYQIISTQKDEHVGVFSQLKFSKGNSLYVLKLLNPDDYQKQADFEKIIDSILQTNACFSKFLFFERNLMNQKIFDLVFDYGEQVRNLEESEFWAAVRQVVSAMISLEQQGRHYPCLNKWFLLRNKQNEFFLLNPFCFQSFIKDCLEVYLSWEVSPLEKQNYFYKKIKENLNQFGELIIDLILGSQKEILELPQSKMLGFIIKKYQNKLKGDELALISFLFNQEENLRPKSFQEILKFVDQLRPVQAQGFLQSLFQFKKENPQGNVEHVNRQTFLMTKIDIFEDKKESKKNSFLKSSQLFEIGKATKNLSILYEDSLLFDQPQVQQSLKDSLDFQLKDFLNKQMQNDSIYLEDFKKEEESFSSYTDKKSWKLSTNNYEIFVNKNQQEMNYKSNQIYKEKTQEIENQIPQEEFSDTEKSKNVSESVKPQNSQEKIIKFIIRFDNTVSQFKKFAVYESGDQVEVKLSQKEIEDLQIIKTSSASQQKHQNQQQKETKQQITPFVLENQKQQNAQDIKLVLHNNEQLFLLFQTQHSTQEKYLQLKKLVNQTSFYKQALYHEHDFEEEQIILQQLKEKFKEN